MGPIDVVLKTKEALFFWITNSTENREHYEINDRIYQILEEKKLSNVVFWAVDWSKKIYASEFIVDEI